MHMPDLSGQSIGRYHVIEPLGEGGMATVYKAFDTRLETDVALKVIRTDRFTPEMLEGALKRFEREAKSLARLTHPNIVKVTDYGEYEGHPYLVMVYLPGGTLKERMGQPMPWSEAARILVPIARALEFAHQQGVIHRDIKPSNILITKSGEPMLSDFGVAKIISDEATTGLTGTGMAVGTPEYMAPEQINAKTADRRADIYALGIVFYEMVTGRKPFQADTPLAVLFKHVSDPLPHPAQFVPNLPKSVENVLFKALAKQPEDRYQTMDEFAAALEKIASGDQSSAAAKRKNEKAVGKREVFVKPPIRAAEPKPEDEKEVLKTVVAQAVSSDAVPSQPVKPTKPLRSIKLLLPLGIVVILLGIFIPLGIRYLKPVTSIQTPTGGPAVTDTATSAPILTVTDSPTLTLTATTAPSPTTASEPTLDIGSTWVRPADGMTMVYVPAGEFTMGIGEGASTSAPAHNVYLDAFWIDQTEVTNAMYAKCVEAGVCKPPSQSSSATHTRYYGDFNFDNYPVIYVSWTDADAYCQWARARLPTDAEWEKAARGADGRIFPWGGDDYGNASCSQANYWQGIGIGFCVGDTVAVGSYPTGVSPYGALDMSGNVWEWVADWFSKTYYSYSPQRNPAGPNSGEFRVIRGGSWQDGDITTIGRNWRDPNGGINYLGFRCAVSSVAP
jgi:serine/threonine-protein kinase